MKISAFDAGLKLLAYGDKTKRQMTDRLLQKGYPQNEVEVAVQKLLDYGYVDDLAFACRYVAKHGGKRGSEQLLWELAGKGVEEETARQAIKEQE